MHLRIVVAIATLTASLNFIEASPLRKPPSFYSYSEPFEENCEIIVAAAEESEFLFSRAGLVQTTYRWPNNTVIYNMDSPPFTQSEKDLVAISLVKIQNVTCVKFVKRTNEDYYINVTANSGCAAQVGYQKRSQQSGTQILNLERKGCFSTGTIIHEFLHALGFYHTQSAPDRDDFVTIKWENIQKGKEHNFDKYGEDVVTDFGIDYDYGRIMHYGPTFFSANNQPTIEPHDAAYKNVIGQRKELSAKDIASINIMYKCF